MGVAQLLVGVSDLVSLSHLPASDPVQPGSSGFHGLRTTNSDWTESAVNGSHYWYEYEGSAMCNLTTPDKDCVRKKIRKISGEGRARTDDLGVSRSLL
eukprot:sb/3478952/